MGRRLTEHYGDVDEEEDEVDEVTFAGEDGHFFFLFFFFSIFVGVVW